MIIDVHTHIGFGGEVTTTPQQLLASMNANKIDHALVLAAPMFNCPTTKLLEEISTFDRLHAIASISISDDGDINKRTKEILKNLLDNNKIHGLKIYTGYEHIYPKT